MGSSSKQTVGYRIYMGVDQKLCYGPIDAVTRMRVDEKTLLQGFIQDDRVTVNAPNLFGGDKQEGGISGDIDVELGHPNQGVNDYLETKVSDADKLPPYRGVVGIIFRQLWLGNVRYLKAWDFRCQRIHVRQDGLDQWYDETSEIPRVSNYLEEEFEEYSEYSVIEGSGSAFEVETGGTYGNQLYIKDAGGTRNRISRPLGFNLSIGRFEGKFKMTTTGTDDGGAMEILDGNGDEVFHFNPRRQALFDPLRRPAILLNGVSSPFGNTALSNGIWYKVDARYDPNNDNWTCSVYNLDAGGTLVDQETFSVTLGNVGADVSFRAERAGGPLCETKWAEVVIYGNAGDMNPAHIIRECLTDPDWGMGYPESDIDSTYFEASALALFDERFGLSLIWDRQKTIEDFIGEIMRHIDAALYVSKSTGKFVLKLIRDDYTLSELTTLDESSVSEVDDYSRVMFGELVNSVQVVYYDRDISKSSSVAVHDIALVQQQGVEIGTSVQYPGITSAGLASRVAERDLQALSSALISCTVYANRTAANINLGDAFILDWPDLNINSVVMRAQEISYGSGRSNQIKIKCTQDVFSTPASGYITAEEDLSVDIGGTASAAYPVIATEKPYYMLINDVGETNANSLIAANTDLGYAVVAAGRADGNHINANLNIDDGGGYESVDTLDFAPYGELVADIDAVDTSFYIESGFDLDVVQAGGWCQIGDEVMRVDSIDQDSTGNWLLGAGRGCLDTAPRPHEVDSLGSYVVFWDDYNGSSTTEYSTDESYSAKVLTNTSGDELDISSAVAYAYTFNQRVYRPYPPGNLLINGLSYPASIHLDSSTLISVAWAHRDRTQQTSGTIYDHTASDIGPETNVEYELRIYDGNGVLRHEETGITDTYRVIDISSVTTYGMTVEVYASRGGLLSWMSASHYVTFDGPDSNSFSSDTFDSVGFDPSLLFDSGDDGVWYDFSDTSTMWKDTAGTSPVTTDGNDIARIDDKSGNGHIADQDASGDRPAYKSGGYAEFTAANNDRLEILDSDTNLSWLHKDGDIAIAMLVRFGDVSNPDDQYVSFGTDVSTADVGFALRFDDRSSSGRDERITFVVNRGVSGQPSYDFISADNVATPNTDITVFINKSAGSTLTAYVNNSSIGTATRDYAPDSSDPAREVWIGASNNNGSPFAPLQGRVYQVVARDKAFTAQEMQDLQDYFEFKVP